MTRFAKIERDLAILKWIGAGRFALGAPSLWLLLRVTVGRGFDVVSRRLKVECGSRGAVRQGIWLARTRSGLSLSGPCQPPPCKAAVL